MTGPAIDPHSTPPKRRRWGWQWGLRTTILLVAVVAVVVTILDNRQRIADLQPRIARNKPLARELDIDDPNQMAAVKLDAIWTIWDENEWDVYLPHGATYRLAVATRAVSQDPTTPSQSCPLGPGNHRVAFEITPTAKAWQLVVTVDGQPRLTVAETMDWPTGTFRATGVLGPSQQYPLDGPMFLLRRNFLVQDSKGTLGTSQQHPREGPMFSLSRNFLGPDSKGISTIERSPNSGVAIWIEREPASYPAP